MTKARKMSEQEGKTKEGGSVDKPYTSGYPTSESISKAVGEMMEYWILAKKKELLTIRGLSTQEYVLQTQPSEATIDTINFAIQKGMEIAYGRVEGISFVRIFGGTFTPDGIEKGIMKMKKEDFDKLRKESAGK